MEIQKSCGLLLFDENCRILLVQGRHNHWWFPKGHIEKWESCLQAALRELKEETGLAKSDINISPRLVYQDEYIFTLKGKRVLKFVDYFVGQLLVEPEKEIKIDKKEIQAWKLVPIHDALKLLDFAGQRNILQKAYANFCQV